MATSQQKEILLNDKGKRGPDPQMEYTADAYSDASGSQQKTAALEAT